MTRTALGKGLGALIPEVPQELLKGEKKLTEIEIGKIKPNPYQPRQTFNEEKLAELVQSIQEQGIIQPIVVRKAGEEFELVAGERRFRAAQKLGQTKILAIILEKLPKERMLELSLIENIQREDLNPIDQAKGYKRLIEECGLSQKDLSLKVGKDRSSISNTLRLLNLPLEIQNLITTNDLTEGHARAILALNEENAQINLAKDIVKNGWSVRQVEEIVYKKSHPAPRRMKRRKITPYFEIEEKLKKHFGTSVKIVQKRKKGRIEIEFYSEEELYRILEVLKIPQ
jgi:ParB family chromosome partitioning protein